MICNLPAKPGKEGEKNPRQGEVALNRVQPASLVGAHAQACELRATLHVWSATYICVIFCSLETTTNMSGGAEET